jgi:hypothetical protein
LNVIAPSGTVKLTTDAMEAGAQLQSLRRVASVKVDGHDSRSPAPDRSWSRRHRLPAANRIRVH